MYAEISLPPRAFLSALLQAQWSQDFFFKSCKWLLPYLEISKHLQLFFTQYLVCFISSEVQRIEEKWLRDQEHLCLS